MSEDDQKPIEEAASESGEVTAGEEAVFTPMRFSKEIFDSIYQSVEAIAGLVIKIGPQLDEFSQILADLDRRVEKLENNEKDNSR